MTDDLPSLAALDGAGLAEMLVAAGVLSRAEADRALDRRKQRLRDHLLSQGQQNHGV